MLLITSVSVLKEGSATRPQVSMLFIKETGHLNWTSDIISQQGDNEERYLSQASRMVKGTALRCKHTISGDKNVTIGTRSDTWLKIAMPVNETRTRRAILVPKMNKVKSSRQMTFQYGTEDSKGIPVNKALNPVYRRRLS